ncbi:MAG: DsbA family oxidoreductase [Alphaproteobacteria bacterium]|jgi:predicted DsbA family dithiol-disulfide isomerase
MHIDVYFDTICPWCYIGKRRLERTLAARQMDNVDIRWRPYQLNPDMPRDGLDWQTYLSLKYGSPTRARQVYDTIARSGHCERIGFNFEAIRRTPNTLDSHRLVRYAARAGVATPLVETLFQAYFFRGEDIGDLGVLGRIARQHGLDGPAVDTWLTSDAETDEVRSEDIRARRMGIDGVPCFVIDGRFAISGAQEPEAFYPLLDLAAMEIEGLSGLAAE